MKVPPKETSSINKNKPIPYTSQSTAGHHGQGERRERPWEGKRPATKGCPLTGWRTEFPVISSVIVSFEAQNKMKSQLGTSWPIKLFGHKKVYYPHIFFWSKKRKMCDKKQLKIHTYMNPKERRGKKRQQLTDYDLFIMDSFRKFLFSLNYGGWN